MHRFSAVLVLAAALAAPSLALGETDSEGRTMHTVYSGQTLGKIAKRYRVSIEDLCRVNGIRRGARLRMGQKLVIPDDNYHPAEAPAFASGHWQDYQAKPRRRGYLVLESPTKHWRGYVLSRTGKLLPRAQEAIERLFASWRTGVRHPIDSRLIQLVVRVSDTFGGRPIRVVSGYRERSFAVESKHKVGRAFDFSIPGIPNGALRDYLRTLPRVGVGYYPHSTHVHLDVREESAYWVDEAGPGEPPRYAHRGGATEPPEEPGSEAQASDESSPAPAAAESPGPS